MADLEKRRKHIRKTRSTREHGRRKHIRKTHSSREHGANTFQRTRRARTVDHRGSLQTIDDEKDVTAVEKIMEQELLVLYWKSRQRYVEGESAIPEEKMQKFIQDIQAKHGITMWHLLPNEQDAKDLCRK